MKFTAYLKASSQLHQKSVAANRQILYIGKNKFNLMENIYVCEDVIDLLAFRDIKDDVVIKAYTYDPKKLAEDALKW